MADCSKAFSTATCSVRLKIRFITSVETFYILDSSLDIVLGMSQLCKINPCIDWNERTIRVFCNHRWVSLLICGTDKKVQPVFEEPPKRKLYPLNEPELQELREQLKVLLDSGSIVPSASPYGTHILFAAKKSGAGLRTYTDYYS